MRVLLSLALASLSGCAILFQDHLPAEYSGRSEPFCSTSNGLSSLDIVLAVADVAVGVAYGTSSNPDASAVMVSNLLEAAIFGVSAATGRGWSSDCRAARERWEARSDGEDAAREAATFEKTRKHGLERPDDSHDPSDKPALTWSYWCNRHGCFADADRCRGSCEETSDVWCVYGSDRFYCARDRDRCLERKDEIRVNGLGECVPQHAKMQKPAFADDSNVESPSKPSPRGFFCATSGSVPNAGLCAREKSACRIARSAAITAIDDLDDCDFVESAWCTGERCAPTREACVAQRERSGSDSPECVEAK